MKEINRNQIEYYINQMESGKKDYKQRPKLEAYKIIKGLIDTKLYFSLDDIRNQLPDRSQAALFNYMRFLTDMKVVTKVYKKGNRAKGLYILPKNKYYIKTIQLISEDLFKAKEFIYKAKMSKTNDLKGQYIAHLERVIDKLLLNDFNNMELEK